MPRATISTEAVHKDLKSCPGGFVELRRMTYDKWLNRSEIAMRMKIQQSEGSKKGMEGEVEMANRVVTLLEFKECIVDHNLTDDNDQPLDFNSPSTLKILDPRVGNEIGEFINELHELDPNSDSGLSQ